MTERLDIELAARGMADSREKARAMIIAGNVLVNGDRADKPSTKVSHGDNITLKNAAMPYVSRGGLKLHKALESFGIVLLDKRCLDIGASTGGFTDCMLQNGARQVVSVDVGYGQLDWKLRSDPRVLTLERVNARYLTPEQISGQAGFASVDVSFISLSLIFPAMKLCLEEDADFVALIKPQFEAGRGEVGKKGVVRSPQVHINVINTVLICAISAGLTPLSLDFSPIKGPEGNIEFLLHGVNALKESPVGAGMPESVVRRAHDALL